MNRPGGNVGSLKGATAPWVGNLIVRDPSPRHGETFRGSRAAEETNRRYYGKLKKPVAAHKVSVVFRRLRDAGEFHQVKPGGAAHEALYSKRPRGKAPGEQPPQTRLFLRRMEDRLKRELPPRGRISSIRHGGKSGGAFRGPGPLLV